MADVDVGWPPSRDPEYMSAPSPRFSDWRVGTEAFNAPDPMTALGEAAKRAGESTLSDFGSKAPDAPDIDYATAIKNTIANMGKPGGSGPAAAEDGAVPIIQSPSGNMAALQALSGRPPPAAGHFAIGGLAMQAMPSMMGQLAAMQAATAQAPGQAPGAGAMRPAVPGPLHAAQGMFISQGAGDGTSDSVDAKVSVGEYVIPADVVSGLGQGSSDAGAKILTNLVHQIRAQHARNMAAMPPPR